MLSVVSGIYGGSGNISLPDEGGLLDQTVGENTGRNVRMLKTNSECPVRQLRETLNSFLTPEILKERLPTPSPTHSPGHTGLVLLFDPETPLLLLIHPTQSRGPQASS